MNYIYTSIEDYVKKMYHHLSIFVPEEIDMIEIAARLNIWLYFENVKSKAVERNEVFSMFIDRRLSPQEQWQDFGHELCHVLMHSGNQLQLPPDFILYQESKANNFSLHFCVPTFMLEQLELPAIKREAIEFIAKTFNVEMEFAKVRLERWISQKESYMFYKWVADQSVHYHVENKASDVIYVGRDVDDLPAPPEMLDELYKEFGEVTFFGKSTITIGMVKGYREISKLINEANEKKVMSNNL
jgi:Zn-dependent peptidase ImmA (M78 family)